MEAYVLNGRTRAEVATKHRMEVEKQFNLTQ
jgi:hypothetical protein